MTLHIGSIFVRYLVFMSDTPFLTGIDGEHTESKGGVYDISNKRRLGLTEFQAIQEMRKGVEECIKKEASL